MDLRWLGAWLAANLVAWGAFGWDKRRARRRRRRVPETRLLALAVAGAAGAWLGSWTFRHKTSKRSFQLRLAIASLLHLGLCIAAWRLLGGG